MVFPTICNIFCKKQPASGCGSAGNAGCFIIFIRTLNSEFLENQSVISGKIALLLDFNTTFLQPSLGRTACPPYISKDALPFCPFGTFPHTVGNPPSPPSWASSTAIRLRRLKRKRNVFLHRLVFPTGHPCQPEHLYRRFGTLCICILVIQINHFPNTALNDCLRTFIAWKQRYIQPTVLQAGCVGLLCR